MVLRHGCYANSALSSYVMLGHRWRMNKFSNFKIHRRIYSHCLKFSTAEKRMGKTKRKCNDIFLDYGFTFIERGDEQLPQCVICFKTLSNASMKAYQLKQHLSNTYPQFTDKNRSFFEMKASSFKTMNLDSTRQFQTLSKAVVTASCSFSFEWLRPKKHITLL